jgi:outer membrane biosynthesis protein TonB
MRLGHPSFTSVSKFCLEILPAVVAFAVVGYLLSFFQPDRADGALPPANVIQSTRASEIEEARSDKAMMREVIRTRRIAEEQAAEQAREAKIAAENAPPPSPPVKEASAASPGKEAAPLPPPRRVAQAPRSEPKTKPQAKPALEAKPATAPLPGPQAAEALPPPAAPVEENRGPVMFVVDKAGELTRKAVATTGEAVAWVVSMPASLMTVKGKIFGETPPPQQSGHILKGS